MAGILDTILDSIVSPLTSASNLVVDIKSQVAPDIHLDVTALIQDPTNPLLLIAKPEIKIQGLGTSKTLRPWGRPTKNYFPAVVLALILFILLNFYAGYRFGKRS